MAIPKRYKKQIKQVYSTSREGTGSRPIRRKEWMFRVGDLVRHPVDEIWGIVVSKPTSSGMMNILTPSGKKRWYASKIERIQKL